MGSKNLTSGQFPTVGTSDATGAKALPVIGAQITAKKGFGKATDPSLERKGNRRGMKKPETTGARYAVTVSRAVAEPAHGNGVHMMPASHAQRDAWYSSYSSFGQGGN